MNAKNRGARLTASVGVLLLLCSLAACADDSKADVRDAHVRATGEAATKMTTMGEEAAASPAVDLEKKKIGILEVVGSAEVIQRVTDGIEESAEQLGWDTVICDAEGVADKFATCANTLLSQDVDAVISSAIPAEPMLAAMKQAQSDGIPWINIIGGVEENPLFATQVIENEVEMSTCMNDYLIKQLGDGPAEVAYDDYPPLPAVALRVDTFEAQMKDHPNIKLVSKITSDESDFSTYADWAQNTLNRYPDLSAFILTQSPGTPYVANVLAREFKGKTFPDRPLHVALYGNLDILDQVRKGYVDGTCEVPVEASGFETIDVLAQYFGRDTAFVADPMSTYPVDFMAPFLVTKDNLPEEGKYATAPNDYRTFFTAKWGKEFNLS